MSADDQAQPAEPTVAGAEPAADPALAAMMAALGGGGAVDPLALLRAQLAAGGSVDPQAAMIMQVLEQRAQAQAAAAAAQAEQEPDEMEAAEAARAMAARAAQAEEQARNLRALQETVEQVYAELEVLRTRNDALARALGACYLCFGDDALCTECHGRGKPGARPPDPAAFRQYLLPALRRAKAVESQRQQARHAQTERNPERNPERNAERHAERPHRSAAGPPPRPAPGASHDPTV